MDFALVEHNYAIAVGRAPGIVSTACAGLPT